MINPLLNTEGIQIGITYGIEGASESEAQAAGDAFIANNFENGRITIDEVEYQALGISMVLYGTVWLFLIILMYYL